METSGEAPGESSASFWSEVDGIVARALELPPDERGGFVAEACDGRLDLAAEVDSLLRASSAAGEFLECSTRTPPDPAASLQIAPPERVGPYRLLDEIGHGGMSVVYRAERDDGQFRKQVAVKLLAAGWISPGAFRRFQTERQILAATEHPHICRLLDGGVTAAGVPFLVMDLVDGLPLLDYCRQKGLSERERLQLFGQICAAVQYAHQHLIVHRDIKPGNVLVTREGEVKLMDFGIAKVLEEGASLDQTQAGFGAMTPDYASPEQLQGQAVTTQTDVYSLGVLLYELLTGKRPYAAAGKSLGELLKIVDEAEPPRAGLPDELLAIVRCAMAKDAAVRYPSASALEDDVARYLGGRPVRAVSPTRWYALRKWIGRHRLPVLAGSAASILILAATAFALWSAAEARRERALAEQRFRDVRRLANKVLFDYPAALRQVDASTALQLQMATDSLRYLDDLARTRNSDPEILLELARGYTQVGAILGTPRAVNLGRPEKALDAYAKARTILQDLLERNHDLWAARRQLALVLRQLSQLDKRNAPELARQSLAAWQDVYRHQPEQNDLFGLGWAQVRLTELELQPAHARQAIEFFQRFREGKSNDPKGLPEQAYANRLLARSLLAENDPAGALAAARTARDLDEQARSLLSNDAAYRMELSLDLEIIALAHLQQNRLGDAWEHFQQAATLRRTVLQMNAGDEWVQQRTLDILCWVGWTAERQRNWQVADATYREAVKLAPTFTAVQKNDEWNAALGFVYGSEGLLLARQGQRGGCDLLARSAQYFRATHDFDDTVFRQRAAEVERADAACNE